MYHAAMAPLAILFEDDHLLVVDKPAGLVVHPAYKNRDGTLLDALLADRRWTGCQRPSVVGRLDRLTSGLVLIAKTSETHARLQRILAAADSDKIYLAVVAGIADERGVIELPLASDPADRRRRTVSIGGAASTTAFVRIDTTIGDGRARSLLACRLVTGRRHQIRVHLAARGWPIVGDAVYGEALSGFPRHALHAWRLAFTHPVTQARVSVDAPVPTDVWCLLNDGTAGVRVDNVADAALRLSRLR